MAKKKLQTVGETTEKGSMNNDFFMSIIRFGVALAGGDPNDLSGWTIEEKKED